MNSVTSTSSNTFIIGPLAQSTLERKKIKVMQSIMLPATYKKEEKVTKKRT